MSVTKAEIAEAVHQKVGFPKSQCIDIVDEIFETMKQALERGEKLKISGFGCFNPRDKKARTGRNPKTGEPIEITARRVVTFKASPVLKEAMNPAHPAQP